ncbi:MAG: hypothetical protein M1383_01160 [Patescibacteria group bacterium]|nr:hypothetical protein [Patescibacteria group bacterium]
MDTTEVNWSDNGQMIGFSILIRTPDNPLWEAQAVGGHIFYARSPIEVFYELSRRRHGIKFFPCPMKGWGKAALSPLIECLQTVPNPANFDMVQSLLKRLQEL